MKERSFLIIPLCISLSTLLSGCTAEVTKGPGVTPEQYSKDDAVCLEYAGGIRGFWAQDPWAWEKCMQHRGNYLQMPSDPAPRLAAVRRPSYEAQKPKVDPDEQPARDFESAVARDAKGWLANKYDAGSIRNVQVERSGTRITAARGEYTFNGGQKGWARIQYNKRSVPCIEYWDTPGSCRPVNMTSLQWFAAREKAEWDALPPSVKQRRLEQQKISNVRSSDHESKNDCTLMDHMYAPSALGNLAGGLYLGGGCK